jgi:hypothetical protein
MIDPTEIERILRADPTMNDDQKGDAWDAFVQSGSHTELADKLNSLPVSDHTKSRLVSARFEAMPVVHKALAIMSGINRDLLDNAEAHPTVLRALIEQQRGVK